MHTIADIYTDIYMCGQILLSFFLGALVGWERERRGRAAGIRTFGAIAVGACAFGLISLYGLPLNGFMGDPSRIASNVVVGVGFLGAGMIFRGESNMVSGLTTAATLWVTASVGLGIAFKMYAMSVLVAIIMFLVLLMPKLSWWKLVSTKKSR